MEGSHSTTKPIPRENKSAIILANPMQKLKVILLYIFLFLVAISFVYIAKNSYLKQLPFGSSSTSLAAVVKSVNPVGSIDDYSLNIFCTELSTSYVKGISGSAVFLSNPDDQLGIIITNAHVARHLLDQKKQCGVDRN